MAIVLDERVMGRPPVIQSAIGTRGQITMGGRDLQAAQDLALVLRAGALPVPLKVAEVRNDRSEPRRRTRSTRASRAGVIARRARRPHHARATTASPACSPSAASRSTCSTRSPRSPASTPCSRCPGSPGFVLSIGIAVDANVLIFERIREELDRGKTVRTAIDEGFRHAMTRSSTRTCRRSSPPRCSISSAPAR